MPRLKNISGGNLAVSFLDRDVKDGEVIDAPDVQADGDSPLTWSPAHWEPVTDKPAAKAAAKADNTTGKADA